MANNEIIIKETHRGLLYLDGVMVKVLGAGRYKITLVIRLPYFRRPVTEIRLIDVRERDLTIRG